MPYSKSIFWAIVLLSLSHCKKNDNTSPSIENYAVKAVLWRNSAEYKALCYQSFNTAKYHLDSLLSHKEKSNKPRAIIADIDETILDNTPFDAIMIKENRSYSKEKWIDWGKKVNAKPIPGAVNFLNYAEAKGLQVYYISNRYLVQKKETIENLKKIGAPFADEAHVLLKDATSKKGNRREQAMKNSKIIMLIGDNLSDFSSLFDDKTGHQRNEITDSIKKEFGRKFIILPNPVYGDWEKTLYGGSYKLPIGKKDSIIKAQVNDIGKW